MGIRQLRERYSDKDKTESFRILSAIDPPTERLSDKAKALAIFSFLDVIDRKATSLIGLNSLLMTIVSLIALRPIVDNILDPAKTAPGSIVAVPAIAALIFSVVAIAFALNIYRIRWGYFGNVDIDNTAESWKTELQCLAMECAFRTRRLVFIHWLSVMALGVATLSSCALLIGDLR